MAKTLRDRTGRYAGSVGNGKTRAPQPAPIVTAPPPPAVTPTASVEEMFARYVELTGTTGHVIESSFRNSLGQHVAAVTCPAAHGTVMVTTDERGLGVCPCGQHL